MSPRNRDTGGRAAQGGRNSGRNAARAGRAVGQHARALLFSALGDETRLALLAKLSGGSSYSISRLAEGSRLTRQAITKHLRVLEGAGMVRRTRAGRESLFGLDPRPLTEMQAYLAGVSKQWDEALTSLKAFVEG